MIDRIEEKTYLQSLLQEEEPQFVAVFRRRRISKTYLVRESFCHSLTFSHTGISKSSTSKKNQTQAQLDKFAESLSEAGFSPNGRITSWNEAFNNLKTVIKNPKDRKKVIFIDELSRMDTKDSCLVSALESFCIGWATTR